MTKSAPAAAIIPHKQAFLNFWNIYIVLQSKQTLKRALTTIYTIDYHFSISGSYVLVWKRGIAVLTAGPVKVTPDPRVRLLQTPATSSSLPGIPGFSGSGGYSLELKDVRPQDAGDYICQIGTIEPREITHTLEILGELIVKTEKNKDSKLAE